MFQQDIYSNSWCAGKLLMKIQMGYVSFSESHACTIVWWALVVPYRCCAVKWHHLLMLGDGVCLCYWYVLIFVVLAAQVLMMIKSLYKDPMVRPKSGTRTLSIPVPCRWSLAHQRILSLTQCSGNSKQWPSLSAHSKSWSAGNLINLEKFLLRNYKITGQRLAR